MIQAIAVVDLRKKKILYTDNGVDAYWSTDGRRMIYMGSSGGRLSVTIRNHVTGEVTRDVAPAELGDYFSWAKRGGRDLILTIQGNYYYLDGNLAELPAATVQPCEGFGVGDRPLISKDGQRITAFVRGALVVRDLTDCESILDTGIRGAKADISWDGRYIAFHVPKVSGSGYAIAVVDLHKRTLQIAVSLRGSSLFPSWTRDGRLCFRYDGDDYRGFMMASGFFERSLKTASRDGISRASKAHVDRPVSRDARTVAPDERGDDMERMERAQSSGSHRPPACAELLRGAIVGCRSADCD